MDLGNLRDLAHRFLAPLIMTIVMIGVIRWVHKSGVSKMPQEASVAIPKTKLGRILSTIAVVWFLFVGGFSFYYGNLPIWGSTVPTAEQSVPVQIKGVIRYVTPEIASRSHLAEVLFLRTWWGMLVISALYHAKRVYWPSKKEEDSLK